jgi:hypothetical protein
MPVLSAATCSEGEGKCVREENNEATNSKIQDQKPSSSDEETEADAAQQQIWLCWRTTYFPAETKNVADLGLQQRRPLAFGRQRDVLHVSHTEHLVAARRAAELGVSANMADEDDGFGNTSPLSRCRAVRARPWLAFFSPPVRSPGELLESSGHQLTPSVFDRRILFLWPLRTANGGPFSRCVCVHLKRFASQVTSVKQATDA